MGRKEELVLYPWRPNFFWNMRAKDKRADHSMEKTMTAASVKGRAKLGFASTSFNRAGRAHRHVSGIKWYVGDSLHLREFPILLNRQDG